MDRAGYDTRQHMPAHPAPLLSAQDVYQVAFHRPPPGQRGYDEEQVDAFLDRIEDTLRSKDILTREDVLLARFRPAPPGRRGYDVEEVNTFLDLVADTLRSTPQRQQAAAPAQGAHATSSKLTPTPRLTPEDVAGVRFHKPRPGTCGYHEGEIDAFLERIQATLRGEDDLTAQEVQEAEFDPAAPGQFGYDEDDVDTFLDLVVMTLERTPPPTRRKPVASAPSLAVDDVRAVSFSRAPRGRRGYQESQVDAFLDRIEDTLLGQDNLTAQAVRDVRFSRPLIGRRGYDEDEVDTFLDRVEQQLSEAVRRVPRITTWRELRQLKLPQAPAGERGYRTAQVDRVLEEIGVALDGMLGATSAEVAGAKFTHSLFTGQGYDRSFVDELLPMLAEELRRRGR